MSDIELRNENGKIVGYDSDENKVPVTFEEGAFDSLDTDQINNVAVVNPADGTQGIEDAITSDDTLVRLKPGEYTGGTITIPYNNVIIRGCGGRAHAADNNDDGAITRLKKTEDGPIIETTADFPEGGLHLADIDIDGNKSNYAGPCIRLQDTSGYHRIERCFLRNSGTNLIEADEIFNTRIIDNKLKNPNGWGIQLGSGSSNVSHTLIKQNDYRDTDFQGSGFLDLRDGTAVRIKDNDGSPVSGTFCRLGEDQGCTNINFSDNYVEGQFGVDSLKCVIKAGTNNQINELTVRRNNSFAFSGYGIDIVSAQRAVIEGNRMPSGNGINGIRIQDGSNIIYHSNNKSVNGTVFDTSVRRVGNVSENSEGQQELALNDGNGGTVYVRAVNGEVVVEDDNGNTTTIN